MSPITHLLISWAALERRVETRGERAWIVFAGLAPDLDGLGIVIDFFTRTFGLVATDYYQSIHRHIGHGFAAACLLSLVAAASTATHRMRLALCVFLSMHLHYLGDLIGSRGSTAEDIWGIFYFSPFMWDTEFSRSGQWALVGWQNTLITLLLLSLCFWQAWHHGYSPLGLVSPKADRALVETLRARFKP